MHASALRTRQLALALITCLSMVLLSSQAALCFGRPGHMVLEFEGRGGCAEGSAHRSDVADCFCEDEHCGAGCIRLGLLNAAVSRNLNANNSAVPLAAVPSPQFPFLAPPKSASSPLEASSPAFLLASLRTTVLRI